MASAVYVHIPFCTSKCYYCDFNSNAVKGQPVDDYLTALAKEMSLITTKNPPNKIKSIFIGGGTPTVLTHQQIELLFSSIHRNFPNWEKDIEYTVEANPGTLNENKLKVMQQYGVNRISMGVQAFQDELLTYIGRLHNKRDVYQSIEAARNQGFYNISIDLMLGLPTQTLAMLQESLTKALQLELPHISVYSLKVEENTPFYQLYEKDTLPLPDEFDELAMYLHTIEGMTKHGLNQYEISNFAKPSFTSKHNINYWKNGEYYGLGAGAHGYLSGKRQENIKGFNSYIEILIKKHKLPIIDEYEVSLKEKMENTMILGLRMLEGVKYADFEETYQQDLRSLYKTQLTKLIKSGLLIPDCKGIKLSEKGLIFGNEVFSQFI